MGGFQGKLGPAVGYMWRGVWCVRSHNPYPRNPRTKAQTAHREMFKREVQLAASMSWAVNLGFRELAYDMRMTSYNLFVHLNQGAFGWTADASDGTEESGREASGVFTVDYSALRLCSGQRAAVAFGTPLWDADNVLSVDFGKDASGLRADLYDKVYLYAYCPDLGNGFLASPVYRRAKRISVALPDQYAGHALHLYGMVCSAKGEWSETVYAGELQGPTDSRPTPAASVEPEAVAATPAGAGTTAPTVADVASAVRPALKDARGKPAAGS